MRTADDKRPKKCRRIRFLMSITLYNRYFLRSGHTLTPKKEKNLRHGEKTVKKRARPMISNRKSKNRQARGTCRFFGRGDGIRTRDLMVPNHARYQTALRLDSVYILLHLMRFVNYLTGIFIPLIS